jgi:peptidoglycan/xylan/chitin deacetylase (PgdA/CDA1 family)
MESIDGFENRELGNVVGLSFDDGPSYWTNSILRTLAAFEARATFFAIGELIAARPTTAKRLVSAGHELGNHSYTHRAPLTELTDDVLKEEISLANDEIENVTRARPRLFRPPWLAADSRVLEVAARHGLEFVINGSVSTADYEADSPAAIAGQIVSRTMAGSVIVLHDGRPPHEPSDASLPSRVATAQALPIILDQLRPSFRFLRVSDLLSRAGY